MDYNSSFIGLRWGVRGLDSRVLQNLARSKNKPVLMPGELALMEKYSMFSDTTGFQISGITSDISGVGLLQIKQLLIFRINLYHNFLPG